MERVLATIRMYWVELIAAVVFAAAVWRYIQMAEWEAQLTPFAWAAFGFAGVAASEEVASWTGRYGWTRDRWLEYPGHWVKFFGAIALAIGAVRLYWA